MGGLPGAGFRLLVREAHVFGAEHDVLEHRLLKELVFRVLEHHAHLEAHRPDFLGLGPDVLAVQQHLARGGPQQAVEHLDEGGLAAARVADNPQELPFLHLDVHPIHGGFLKGGAWAVAVCQVLGFDNRQLAFPFLSQRFSAGFPGQVAAEHAHALLHTQGHPRQFNPRGGQPVAELRGLGHVQVVAL